MPETLATYVGRDGQRTGRFTELSETLGIWMLVIRS